MEAESKLLLLGTPQRQSKSVEIPNIKPLRFLQLLYPTQDEGSIGIVEQTIQNAYLHFIYLYGGLLKWTSHYFFSRYPRSHLLLFENVIEKCKISGCRWLQTFLPTKPHIRRTTTQWATTPIWGIQDGELILIEPHLLSQTHAPLGVYCEGVKIHIIRWHTPSMDRLFSQSSKLFSPVNLSVSASSNTLFINPACLAPFQGTCLFTTLLPAWPIEMDKRSCGMKIPHRSQKSLPSSTHKQHEELDSSFHYTQTSLPFSKFHPTSPSYTSHFKLHQRGLHTQGKSNSFPMQIDLSSIVSDGFALLAIAWEGGCIEIWKKTGLLLPNQIIDEYWTVFRIHNVNQNVIWMKFDPSGDNLAILTTSCVYLFPVLVRDIAPYKLSSFHVGGFRSVLRQTNYVSAFWLTTYDIAILSDEANVHFLRCQSNPCMGAWKEILMCSLQSLLKGQEQPNRLQSFVKMDFNSVIQHFYITFGGSQLFVVDCRGLFADDVNTQSFSVEPYSLEFPMPKPTVKSSVPSNLSSNVPLNVSPSTTMPNILNFTLDISHQGHYLAVIYEGHSSIYIYHQASWRFNQPILHTRASLLQKLIPPHPLWTPVGLAFAPTDQDGFECSLLAVSWKVEKPDEDQPAQVSCIYALPNPCGQIQDSNFSRNKIESEIQDPMNSYPHKNLTHDDNYLPQNTTNVSYISKFNEIHSNINTRLNARLGLHGIRSSQLGSPLHSESDMLSELPKMSTFSSQASRK